jgi:hypothetical protein
MATSSKQQGAIGSKKTSLFLGASQWPGILVHMKQYLTYDKSIPTDNFFYGYGKNDFEALYDYSIFYK